MQSTNSSKQPIRVGLVGAGTIGDVHLRAYSQIPAVQIVAIADAQPERLEQFGRIFNVPDHYVDYLDLIARDDIDAISVCTPNQYHAPITIAALEAGKHVLCEKPLARSYAEGRGMVDAAGKAGRILKVAFNHRERGDVKVLKSYIDVGELGHIYHAKATWMRRSGIPGVGGWFTSKEMAGGGPLIDLGVHVLDMALYLLGEPKVASVSAATYSELGPRGRGNWGEYRLTGSGGYEVEDLATAFIRMVDGSTLLLEASWAVYGKSADDFGVTLFGTNGGAEIEVKNYGWENTLRIFTDVVGVPAEVQPRVNKGDGHLGVIREFIDQIRSGDWAYNGEQGLYRTLIIDACYTSAIERREVVLENAGVE